MRILTDSIVKEFEYNLEWNPALLELRNIFELMIRGEFSKAECDIYILAYDFGLTEGVCGINSIAGAGLRKGLMDAIHLSPISHSPYLLNMIIGLGMEHGASISERIRAEIANSNGTAAH
ncbi:hypothetical protein [Burkholderia diffusa]|uniref:hypothetical protein n=1 Tax=Burkholderia diffusa TaxID=488732 RepID=UPI000A6251A8|nr:hypothetical protein [Burkholderia diffusa]